MATTDGGALAKEAAGLVDSAGGLAPFIEKYGFGGVAWAFFIRIISAIDGAGTIIVGIPKAVGEGMILLIDELFVGFVLVYMAGSEQAAQSFSTGVASYLGPLAQPAAVGTVTISIFVFWYLLQNVGWNPAAIWGSVRR